MPCPSHILSAAFAVGFLPIAVFAQLSATDDFQSYAGGSNPAGVAGGDGDWVIPWQQGTQNGGGNYINTASKIDGTQSLGLFGNGSAAGQSVHRPFLACTSDLTVAWSMRGDFNANSTNAPNPRRLAFTIRAGNEPGHFTNQRLSFFFAAGTTNFQWYDGTDRITSAVNFTLNHVYDLRAQLQPATRTYSFTVSNRNNGTSFSYNGAWSLGYNGEPLASVAAFMRGPTGAGNDAFFDNVSVTSPGFTKPGPSIREGDGWLYRKGTSTPTAQGTNQWHSLAYDAATWLGPAPSGFGYGDCDDATELGDMLNGYNSVYARRTFFVADAAAINKLSVGADYDDGAVVYLNGQEVLRLNMPGGVILHNTGAAGNHEASRGDGSGSPTPKEFHAIDPALLVNGTNIIAVSGHNVSSNSSDFSLLIELYTNAALTRGPFVQMPQPGGAVTIAWNTAALVDSVVDYGLDLSYGGGTVSNGTPKREHALAMANLAPGTTYYYRVRGNGEILAEGLTFRTRPSASQSFRFVVIGDHGQGTPQMTTIANLINARADFDAIMTVGDNIYGLLPCGLDGAPGWYDPYWFQLYAPTMRRVATFPALGNHDWDTAQGQYMVDFFHLPTNGPAGHTEKNYSFEFGNMHVIVIDTEPFDESRAETNAIANWITGDLAAATQQWKVALLHRPPFTSRSSSHSDNARVKTHIVPRLKAGGVQLVFQGHNHWYERINAIDGIQYITTAGAGAGLYDVVDRREYSARWAKEFSYTLVDVQGRRMTIQQINEGGSVIDTHVVDIGNPFAIDGLLDNPAWQRAANGLNLHAAIRGQHLYVATQDAGEGSDHFLYVAGQTSTQRPANWAKSGTIMQWSAFLADENDGAFQGWHGPDGTFLSDTERYQSMTSGTNNNAPAGNGVLEGTLHLAGHFGSFPTQLLFAAAPYATAGGGGLVAAAQAPAGNLDGDIQPGEFLTLATRDLALDLPAADAGAAQNVEAGMWVVLNGGGMSPAGLPLAYAWQQTAGPAVTTANLGTPMAAFVIASNVAANTDVTFQLTVNDGRFDSDPDLVTVTLTPMVDSDGDGLSDQEELTGYNNLLTAADPSGRTSNPALADTDGDGATDGEEALAGTLPQDAGSTFKILSGATEATGLVIDWVAVTGRAYRVEYHHHLFPTGWTTLSTIPATSPVMRVVDTNEFNTTGRFYRIQTGF